MTPGGLVRARIWMAFAVTLFSGMAIGFALGAFMFGSPSRPSDSNIAAGDGGLEHAGAIKRGRSGGGLCGGMERRLLERFSKELDLTPEQRKRVKPILAKMVSEIERIHREKRPEIRAVIASCINEIKGELTPEQRARLERLEERVCHGGGCGGGAYGSPIGHGGGGKRRGGRSGRERAR